MVITKSYVCFLIDYIIIWLLEFYYYLIIIYLGDFDRSKDFGVEIKISAIWNFPHPPFISFSVSWHCHHHHIRGWHNWGKVFYACFLHYWALKLNAEFDSFVQFFLPLPFFQGSRVCFVHLHASYCGLIKTKLSSNLQVVSYIRTQWQCFDTELIFLCFCFRYTSWHHLFWKVGVKSC